MVLCVIFQGLLFQEVLLCHQLSSVLLGIGSRCYSPRIGGVLDSNQLVTKGIISYCLGVNWSRRCVMVLCVIFQGLLFQEVLLCHQLSSVLLGIGFGIASYLLFCPTRASIIGFSFYSWSWA